jgi:dihydroneopterin aldolase
LIETLAVDVAGMILEEFSPKAVSVEVKKFAIPQARYAAVRVTRPS